MRKKITLVTTDNTNYIRHNEKQVAKEIYCNSTLTVCLNSTQMISCIFHSGYCDCPLALFSSVLQRKQENMFKCKLYQCRNHLQINLVKQPILYKRSAPILNIKSIFMLKIGLERNNHIPGENHKLVFFFF